MAAGFTVLTTADAERWSALIARLPVNERDIHFLPEYGRVYEATHGIEARLAVFEGEYGFVLQPFILRPLDGLPFLKESGVAGHFADIANPYGYGGPLYVCGAHAAPQSLLAHFEREFLGYCKSQHYASEFCSLHPLISNTQEIEASGGIALKAEKQIVYMDLSATEDEIWREVRKGHKSGIGKARKLGVNIARVAASSENLSVFKALYYETMKRNQAGSRWFHPESYFGNCLEILGDERCSLHFSTIGGELAAAAMLIHDFGIAYYHFAGSDPRFNSTSAGNLLVYECALWAKRAKYRYFHLGGGVTAEEDDSLFIFKSGFSQHRATLYTYGRTLDPAAYQTLSELKIRYERNAGWDGNTGYFPLYRR